MYISLESSNAIKKKQLLFQRRETYSSLAKIIRSLENRNFSRNKFVILSDMVRKKIPRAQEPKKKRNEEKMSSIDKVHCQNSSVSISLALPWYFF